MTIFFVLYKVASNLFDISLGREGGRGIMTSFHSFIVFAPVTMTFGTGMNVDMFYRIVTKEVVTSLLLRNYDVTTYIFANWA